MPLDAARWQLELAAADRTAQAFDSVQRRMKQTQAASQATATAMSTGFGAAANRGVAALAGSFSSLVPALSAAAVAQRVWSAGMKAGDLGEQAEQVGLTVDQLQAYRLVAAQAGIANEQLDGAMVKLTRSMGEAGGGNEELIAKFDKLGVKLLDSEGNLRKVGDVAPEVARGLLTVGSETERNALLMDLFGKSGMKMVTMLGDLSQGNEAVIASAKEQGAVVSGETAAAWDKLGDRMKVANMQLDAWIATAGAPIAVSGLEHVLAVFESTRKEIEAIQKAWGWLTKTTSQAFDGGSSETLIKRSETIKAHMDVLKDSTDALDVAKLAGYRQELQRISDTLAGRAKVYEMPAATITAERPGVGQPTGGKKSGTAAATDANKQFAESQKAMDALVEESMRQFEQAQQIMIQYGDGTAYAATEMQKLVELAPFFETQPQIMQAAQQAIADRARDMDIAFRGAQGGATGFIAGLEASMVALEKANSAFELGQALVSNLSASFADAAMSGELNFQKIAASFANMLAQMAIQAAIHASLKMFLSAFGGGGMGGTGGGLLDGLFGMIFGSPFMAEGGPVSGGQSYVVGEEGPELFVPRTGGTIIPNHALRRGRDDGGMGGGGPTIVINQTVHVGEYVTSTQYLQGLRAVEKSAREGARQGLIEDGRRGDPRIAEAFR